MSAHNVNGFTDAQALSTLLAVEGFLLAAISLSISLSAPNQARPMSFGWLKPAHMARVAACILVFVALGALAAWSSIFTGGSFGGFTRLLVAAALLVALVAQPLLALGLAFGAKRR